MTQQKQNPTEPTAEKSKDEPSEVISNPMEEIQKQRSKYSMMRINAEAEVMKGVKGLQKLNQISKGAGKPTLHEFIKLFSALGGATSATAQEGQLATQVLTGTAYQQGIQAEAILRILRDKGIVTEEEFAAQVDTIVSEQRAAAEKRKKETIQASIDQVKNVTAK